MKTILKTVAVGLACLSASGHLLAQPDRVISLELEVVSEKIGAIDPLVFVVRVTNNSDLPLTDLPVWAIEETSSVEIIAPGTSAWKSIVVPFMERYKNRCVPLDRFRFGLKPRETKSFEMWVVYDPYLSYQQERAYYYFSTPGEYRLRTSYQPVLGKHVYSNEVKFTVQPYTGADLEAYNWLKDKPIPHFVYDPDTYVQVNMHEADEWAQELLTRFPSSRFAPYAQLYLANCFLLGLRTATEIQPPNIMEADRLASGLVNASDLRVRNQAREILQSVEAKRQLMEADR